MPFDKERYVEARRNGADPVGSFGARRISEEMRDWIANEAHRTKRTQRAVMEDILEAFIKHRNNFQGRYPYENIPRSHGKTFRLFMRLDLLDEIHEIVKRDGVFHGDIVNAAIKYEMSKGSHA